MVSIRVPYPLGFYAKGFDGRIDDPNAGWKGRGLWAANGDRTPWLIEGGALRAGPRGGDKSHGGPRVAKASDVARREPCAAVNQRRSPGCAKRNPGKAPSKAGAISWCKSSPGKA